MSGPTGSRRRGEPSLLLPCANSSAQTLGAVILVGITASLSYPGMLALVSRVALLVLLPAAAVWATAGLPRDRA